MNSSKVNHGEITKRVLGLMEKKKVTQYRMCKDLGIPSSTVTAIRQGKANWSIDHVVMMSDYFGVTVGMLIYGDDSYMSVRETFNEVGEPIVVYDIHSSKKAEYLRTLKEKDTIIEKLSDENAKLEDVVRKTGAALLREVGEMAAEDPVKKRRKG